MAILSKACKLDNFELYNSLKLSFMNIQGLCSIFVDWESFLESNSSDILPLCETNLNGSVDSRNFFVRGNLLIIWKDSSTHMQDLSLENSADSYLCFRLNVLLLFPLSFSPSSSLCMGFDSISSNMDEVLLVNPSANVFGDIKCASCGLAYLLWWHW